MTVMWPCCPFLFEAAGLTVSSTSCPSIVGNSIKRPMDTDTGRQRISADTCACVVPYSISKSEMILRRQGGADVGVLPVRRGTRRRCQRR
jgi:hypothetical protein